MIANVLNGIAVPRERHSAAVGYLRPVGLQAWRLFRVSFQLNSWVGTLEHEQRVTVTYDWNLEEDPLLGAKLPAGRGGWIGRRAEECNEGRSAMASPLRRGLTDRHEPWPLGLEQP